MGCLIAESVVSRLLNADAEPPRKDSQQHILRCGLTAANGVNDVHKCENALHMDWPTHS